jgi:hypothetical protein
MLINRVTCLLLHYFFLSISLADLQPSLFALSDEKCAQLGVENSLAEEKALRQAAEQSLQQSKDSNATLALELENTQTSLAATRDKLDSKLKALDLQVFRADDDMLRLGRVGPVRPARPKGRIGQWVARWGWRWPARQSGTE